MNPICLLGEGHECGIPLEKLGKGGTMEEKVGTSQIGSSRWAVTALFRKWRFDPHSRFATDAGGPKWGNPLLSVCEREYLRFMACGEDNCSKRRPSLLSVVSAIDPKFLSRFLSSV